MENEVEKKKEPAGDKAVVVIGVSECLGVKDMTEAELARAKASGYVPKGGLRKVTKAVEAYYVLATAFAEKLAAQPLFWSNCEGKGVLDELIAAGAEPVMATANSGKTDFGLRPSNGMRDHVAAVRRRIGDKDAPIYHFTASYSDGMRYSSSVYFGKDGKPLGPVMTRIRDGEETLYAGVGTPDERELKPGEFSRTRLYTVSGMWKRLEPSVYAALDFDSEVVSTAGTTDWRAGHDRLKAAAGSYDPARDEAYDAYLRTRPKALEKAEG